MSDRSLDPEKDLDEQIRQKVKSAPGQGTAYLGRKKENSSSGKPVSELTTARGTGLADLTPSTERVFRAWINRELGRGR